MKPNSAYWVHAARFAVYAQDYSQAHEYLTNAFLIWQEGDEFSQDQILSAIGELECTSI